MKKQIPNYRIDPFAAKSHSYALIIYTINENGRLKRELAKLRDHNFAVDVIVADGGSTDGSTKKSFLKSAGVTALLTKLSTGGLSAQMRMAFDYCLKQKYKGVICIDGNDKDDSKSVPRFVDKLEEGFDHIQGSRFIPGGHHANTPLFRLLGIKMIHAPFINRAAGYHYTDTTNGFRAYSARLLKDQEIAPFREIFSRYELHYHLAVESVRRGYRVTEIPVTRIYPKGEIPTKIKSLKNLLEIILVLLKLNFGYYRQV